MLKKMFRKKPAAREPSTVVSVDVARYCGTWYEIGLKVHFFRFFKGDYWIVDLADDYSWTAVSTPTAKSFWILSRTPYLGDAVYDEIVQRLKGRGFDTDSRVKKYGGVFSLSWYGLCRRTRR